MLNNVKIDVVIIGGGPAGAQCALWIDHLGYKAVILERSSELGGLQAISPYENNWLVTNQGMSGIDIAKVIAKNIENSSVIVEKNSDVTAIAKRGKRIIVTSKDCEYDARFLVVATGTVPRDGGIAKNSNIFIGPGTQIEEANFAGKSVAILGGGDNAIENYVFIKKQNPKSIQIYARSIRARENLISNIDVKDLYVGKYEYADNKVTSELGTIAYDTIVVLYGWQGSYPSTLDQLGIVTTKDNFLKVNDVCATSIDNIYAIGDINNRNHPSVVTAMADGTIAAKDICDKLAKE